MGVANVANRIEHRLARSPRAAKLAAALSRHGNLMVGYHFAPTAHADGNGEHWLLDHLAPRIGRFVDIGANIGDWTADLHARNPSAEGIAVEPGEQAYHQLVARHPWGLQTVQAAVSDTPGTLTFHELPGASEHSSAAERRSPDAVERTVPAVTVDTLLADAGWDSVDLLKIDTEGYDLHALRGAQETLQGQRAAVVQFEYSDRWRSAGSTLAAALALLDTAAYTVHVLTPTGLATFDYRTYGEFFNYSNFVATTPAAAALFSSRC